MNNKVILITGATQGIGKVTALTLARQGHHIIIHGRSQAKLQDVKAELQNESGNQSIDIITADLLSLEDTRRMADELNDGYDHLDVLINNAGAIFNKDRETTKEGFEKTLALNLLSPFLLMQSLLPLLQKSKSARIINLASAMHRRGGKPDFNDFQFEKNYSPNKAYGRAKLYLIWVTQYFAKQLKERGINNVTVNASHPGAVATNFGQDADKGFIINLIFKVALRFMDKIEDGARTSIYLATSPEVNEVSGKFFNNKEQLETPDQKYYSAANEQSVWDYCVQVTQKYLK